MLKEIFAYISTCCILSTIHAQDIGNCAFNASRNPNPITYKDTFGKTYDCGMKLECMYLNIVFYSVRFDTVNHLLSLKGNTYASANQRDTARMSNVTILLATPDQQTLTQVINLGKSAGQNSSEHYPYRLGDFDLLFKLPKKSKLYFIHPIFHLVEYDLEALFKKQ